MNKNYRKFIINPIFNWQITVDQIHQKNGFKSNTPLKY